MIFLNPIVFHCLPGSQSFIRVQLEESKQQITALLAQSLGEGEWAKVVVMAGLAKRRFDGEHLVHENADTPAVDFVVVVGPLCDFGGDVVEGAAEGSSLTVSLDGPSEIGDFEMVVEADHVFWFQVAMNYAVSMKVLNSR